MIKIFKIKLSLAKHFLINILKRVKNLIKNKDKAMPVFPSLANTGVKIHIGAGEINLQGWINVDARPFDHIHIVSEELDLKEFSDDSVTEIYMSHILEHVPFSKVLNIFKHFNKKLKVGGILRVSVPDFDSIVKIYTNNNNNLDTVKYTLMGGQDYEHNFHYSVYNLKALESIFKKAKFNNINKWNTKEDFGLEFGDWSSYKFQTKKEDIEISLNLKATKI